MKPIIKTLLAAVATATTAMSVEADNRLYIENFDIAPGETKNVSIILDNTTDYVAFQSDIYLPEGLTATNWLLTERKGDHNLSTNTPATGISRIVAISMSNSSIEGNTGALVTFDVTATKDLVAGTTLNGKVANNQFSPITGKYETLADEPYTVTIVEPLVEADNRFYIEDFTIEAGAQDYVLPLYLNNEIQFTGFTADLILPQGMTTDDYMWGNPARTNRHTYNAETQTDGSIKLTATSTRVFNGYEGELVYIYLFTSSDFVGTHTLELRNIIFTDATGATYKLPNSNCTVQGPDIENNEVELILQNSYYNNITLYLTKGSRQKLKIESTNSNYMLNTVLFNGKDVTNDLVEGAYTTPPIEENSILNVSFIIPTAQNSLLHDSSIKAYGHEGHIVVSGCEAGDNIAIYNVDGTLLRTQYALDNIVRIEMPTEAIYLVNVENISVKVAL